MRIEVKHWLPTLEDAETVIGYEAALNGTAWQMVDAGYREDLEEDDAFAKAHTELNKAYQEKHSE